MKVIRASASYSRTIQPAPYESKVAKAEIEYSFSEDETISGERALQIAMNAAVAQVHSTLGLAMTTKVVVVPLAELPVVHHYPDPAALTSMDPPTGVAAAEKPTRGRPKKNANPTTEEAKATPPVAGTVAGAVEAPQAIAAPVIATAAEPEVKAEIITDGDLVKACSLTTARLREAGDATGAQKVKAARDAVIGQPGQAVISMLQAKRAGFIAALKELK